MGKIVFGHQGDVMFIRVNSLPEGAVKVARDARKRHVLALGETTGHIHAIETEGVDLYTLNGQRWLVAPDGAEVKHMNADGLLTGEHDTAVLAPDTVWLVVSQYEYEAAEFRRVLD